MVGDDRCDDFRSGMSPYAVEWGARSFDVVSSGKRDPDSKDIVGMSASKARHYANEGNFAKFASILPDTINNTIKQKVFNCIRS